MHALTNGALPTFAARQAHQLSRVSSGMGKLGCKKRVSRFRIICRYTRPILVLCWRRVLQAQRFQLDA